MMIELCSLRGLLSANCSKGSCWSLPFGPIENLCKFTVLIAYSLFLSLAPPIRKRVDPSLSRAVLKPPGYSYWQPRTGSFGSMLTSLLGMNS